MKKMALIAIPCLLVLIAGCEGETPKTDPTAAGGSAGAGGTGGAGGAAGSGGSAGMGGGAATYSFVKVGGFNGAESCYWDAENKVWYVSNMAPQSMDLLMPDGVGWISKLVMNGDTPQLTEQWVAGFDTPAGLRMHNGILYVANINKMHGIDVKTGMIVENYNFPAAILLNDPAVDAMGNVYITDTFGNAIYTFKAGMAGSESEFLSSPDLAGPNGALIDGGKLMVASLVDFNPMNLGPFLSVDLATKAITPIGDVKGKWDGLEKDGANYLLSNNPLGQIVTVSPDGKVDILVDLKTDHQFATAADFGYDPATKTFCVPDLADSVAIVKLP